MNCTICGLPIGDETHIGTGDGTGSSFAHASCYHRRQANNLRTRLEAAEKQAAEDAAHHAAARQRVTALMRERDEARAQAIKEGERIGEMVAEQVVYRARIRELTRVVEVAEMALRSDELPDGDTDVKGWVRRKLAQALIAGGDTRPDILTPTPTREDTP